MGLTVLAIRNAKPKDRQYRMADALGLTLLVVPTGGKLWRYRYRFEGKEAVLSFGAWPEVSLDDARGQRDDARKLLRNGIDPASLRKLGKEAERAKEAEAAQAAVEARSTFGAVATEYLMKRRREGVADVTAAKADWLLSLLGNDLCGRPIAAITVPELLKALRVVEGQGKLETARRMRSLAGRIFRYGIATGVCERDIAADIRDALTTPTVTHRPAIIDPIRLGALLRAMYEYGGQAATCAALKLAPYLFVRPGELRKMEWQEVNTATSVWVIPATRTKMRKEHRVPLSKQALGIIEGLRALNGDGRHVFRAIGGADKPISENTLNQALRRCGIDTQAEHTAHGFRATAMSLLNESGLWNPDAISRALAHGEKNSVRAIYHRAEYWDERVRMAQWWSDHLDTLRTGAKIVPMVPQKKNRR